MTLKEIVAHSVGKVYINTLFPQKKYLAGYLKRDFTVSFPSFTIVDVDEETQRFRQPLGGNDQLEIDIKWVEVEVDDIMNKGAKVKMNKVSDIILNEDGAAINYKQLKELFQEENKE